MIKKVIKQIFTGGNISYKDFLYKINRDKSFKIKVLKIKEL